MEKYNIKELATLSGVSSRTLRYYDQIKLLSPLTRTSAGYRLYGTKEVDRLQQILVYKKLGFSLQQIQQLLDQPTTTQLILFEQQYQALKQMKQQIELQLNTLEKTIAYQKGDVQMNDQEKFIGLKEEKLIRQQEYQAESSTKYGEAIVNKTIEHLEKKAEHDFQTAEAIEQQLMVLLKNQVLSLDEQTQIVALHKQWLQHYTPYYNKDYHRQLADLYLEDERFQKYYDQKAGEGAAKRLSESIHSLLL